MRYLVFRFFSIVAVSLCLLVVDGCSDDSDLNLNEGWEWPTTEQVIGPEGGTIEVTDSTSQLYGVKVEIPAGALDQETNIVIQDKWVASLLPAGLTSDYPIVEFGPDTKFLKDIQITFPVKYIPSGDDGKILCAFYWDSAKGRWIVVSPKRVIGSEMIIETNKFGLWRWGIVSLSEVETETVADWMEDLFGTWSELQKAVIDQLDPFISVIEDPQNLIYCGTQDSLLSSLSSTREVALQRTADYLASTPALSECKICDENDTCSDCVSDAGKMINDLQPLEWAIKEWQMAIELWWATGLAGAGPMPPGLDDLVGAWLAEGMYKDAIRQVGCDWRCVLKNGSFPFYTDLLVGNACTLYIFFIEAYRSVNGCQP